MLRRARSGPRGALCLALAGAFAACAPSAPADEQEGLGPEGPAGPAGPATPAIGAEPLTTSTTRALVLPPFHSGAPRFRKLIYGLEEEKPVVWLVVDGDDVLCDIDRDGDLSDPDERQSYDGRTAHFVSEDIEVWYHKNLVKSKFEGISQGRLFAPHGPAPEDAPVFHIAGPLKILKERYRNRIDTRMEDVLVYVNIGTESPGVERTELRYECVDSGFVPELTITYADGRESKEPLRSRC